MISSPYASGFVSLDSVAKNFSIQTSDLADVGVYSVTVTATIPLETSPGSGVDMSATFIFEINFTYPCQTSAITAASIPDQTLFAWQFTANPDSISILVPFTEFKAEDTSSHGIDCGPFTYSVSALSWEPHDPSIFTSLSIDPVGLAIGITVEKSLIPEGLTAEISLTGTLQNYSALSHSESFELKIY